PDHPNYHYRKHAANMNVIPSLTGNDPVAEDIEAATDLSGERTADGLSDVSPSPPRGSRQNSRENEKDAHAKQNRSSRHKVSKAAKEGRRHMRALEQIRPPSFWNVYCAIVTFWCPNFLL